MVNAVLNRTAERIGKKKELLTVKELAAEFRVSVKSFQRGYRKGNFPVLWM